MLSVHYFKEGAKASVQKQVRELMGILPIRQLGKFAGEDVPVPEVARRLVRLPDFGNRKRWHRGAKALRPGLDVVERARLRRIRVQRKPEAFRDQLDVGALIYFGKVGKDDGECA